MSVEGASAAIAVIAGRAAAGRVAAEARWREAVGGAAGDTLDVWADRFRHAGRLTLAFHPDRVARDGRTVAAGLSATGRYRSQWATGISAGSRSARPGGERQRFERELFAGAYDRVDRDRTELPVYGSLDLLFDPHGGSPRFGSSFAVLSRHVLDRTTLCVGDSHLGPRDVGTIDAPWALLAALAEQASRSKLLNRELGIDALLDALAGSYRSPRPSRDLDGYVEAQVHGGVSLTEDVESIVLDPSFRGTAVEADLASAAARHQFRLAWHGGSELRVGDVPADFRGPAMPAVAREVARPDGVVDARAIGVGAARVAFGEPTATGDAPDSELQRLKYLWHTLLAHGRDAEPS